MNTLKASFYRGGTSKALMFLKSDLPADIQEWGPIFLKTMGSPDPQARQLNGMGGGSSSLSKVAVVSKSTLSDADVDYTFIQVGVTEAKVDFKGNCGNIVSAVAPFAIDQKLIGVPTDATEITVRIYNTNTQKIIHSTVQVKNGCVVYSGDCEIPGVAGLGSPILIDFINPGGATTGKLLPTGRAKDLLPVEGHGIFEVSLVDAANATVFLKLSDFKLTGIETCEEIEANKELMMLFEKIRQTASVKMGITSSLENAAKSLSVPYVALIGSAVDFKSSDNIFYHKNQMDFNMRVIASGQAHKALPLTVSLCAGVCANIDGTILNEILKNQNRPLGRTLRLGMPSGVLEVSAEVQKNNGEFIASRGGFVRTARPLFVGEVFI